VFRNARSPDGDAAALSPSAFFEEALPAAFEADPGEVERGEDVTLHYHVTGLQGGDWLVQIAQGRMRVDRVVAPALVRYSLTSEDAIAAINRSNGASPVLIVPRPPARSRGGGGALRALRGTLALRLTREHATPFELEMCFNGSERPHTFVEMSLADYVAIQEAERSRPDAFASARMHVEGDVPFLMQVGLVLAS
jgi:hypothetical protein